MTAKRFTLKEYVTNYYAILDNGEEIAYADHKSAFTFCELLNKLNDKNKQLQRRCGAMQEEIEILSEENRELKSESLKQVYKLIDEYIALSDQYRKPIDTLMIGDDLGYWNGVYQYMKKLKKELKELQDE